MRINFKLYEKNLTWNIAYTNDAISSCLYIFTMKMIENDKSAFCFIGLLCVPSFPMLLYNSSIVQIAFGVVI